jgi:hypothetical protein
VTDFTREDLKGSRFTSSDLTGARFVSCELSDVVMRGVEIARTEIDSPWLVESGGPLLVNGVDVVPFVDAELDRRFPGRSQRRALDPEGLQAAWEALQRTWEATVQRAQAMPEGTVDATVDDEWSFSQTLRHLVMATDTWLGKAVLRREQPFHPLGHANAGAERDGLDMSLFTPGTPAFDDVLEARADRVAMVRDHLAAVTPDELADERSNPWAPQYPETVLSCLHTILEEEWEHHRYAVRDLDVLEARGRGDQEEA